MTPEVYETLAAAARRLADPAGAKRIALVTSRDSYESSGARDVIDELLADRIAAHFRVGAPPTAATIGRIMPEFLASEPDGVLAIGGGAVLDIAKATALFAAQHDPHEIAPRQDWGPSGLEITAVPTTAGSGSEATPFAVMYVGDEKHSLAHPSLLPTRVVLDPSLIRSVPWQVAAAAGLDVVAHCVESMWSTRSTDATIERAAKTLGAAAANLVASRHQEPAQRVMQQAAYAAGTCIAVTRTTAAHALSYHLTIHHGVAHGHAVALTLGQVLDFNAQVESATCQDERGPSHVQGVVRRICSSLGAEDVAQAVHIIGDLVAATGLAADLDGVGFDAGDVPAMAQSANAERLATNPRRTLTEDLEWIIGQAMGPR